MLRNHLGLIALLVGFSGVAGDEVKRLLVTPSPQFPTTPWLEVRHPDWTEAVFLVRIPEHIVTLQGRVAEKVVWEKVGEDRWRFRWEEAAAVKQREQTDFWGEVVVGEDELAFTFTIQNPTATAWTHERYNAFDVVAGRVPTFQDPEGKRTFVYLKDHFVSVNEALKGEFSEGLTGWMLLAEDPQNPQFREYTERLMAKVSAEGRWVLAIASDSAGGVTFNLQPGTSCIHQNRTWAPLRPGEERTLRGKVYLFRGTLDDLLERYRRDKEAWEEANQPILREEFRGEKPDPQVWTVEAEEGWTEVQMGHGLCKLTVVRDDEANRAHSAGLRSKQKFQFVEATFHGVEVQGNRAYFGLMAAGWVLVRNDLGYGWQLDVLSDWTSVEAGAAPKPKRQQVNLPAWTGAAEVTVRWSPHQVEVWLNEERVARWDDPDGSLLPQGELGLVFHTYGNVQGHFAALRGVTVRGLEGAQPVKREINYLPTVWAPATKPKALEHWRSLRPRSLPPHPLAPWMADRLVRDLGRTPTEGELQKALQAFQKRGKFFLRQDESGLWVSNGEVGIAFLPGEQGCGVASLYHLPSQTECISAPPEPYIPFRLQVWDGQEVKEIDPQGARASAQVAVKGQQVQVAFRWMSEAWEVGATATLSAASPLLRWRARGQLRESQGRPYALLFPILKHPGGEGENDVVTSWGSGLGQLFRGLKGALWNSGSRYPDSNWSVQFLAMGFGDATLYLACHDGQMHAKAFHLHPGQEFYFTAFIPLGRPSMEPSHPSSVNGWHPFELPYDVVIGPLSGDWFDAARLYRRWAIRQKWCARGPLYQRAQRGTVARRMIEAPLVVRPNWTYDEDEEHGRRMKATEMAGTTELERNRQLFGEDVPMAVWWYKWSRQRFDDDMPLFDPYEEIPAEFRKEVAEGLVVMPYIQSALWDVDTPFFDDRAKAAAVKKPDGTLRTARLYWCEVAEMCLSQPLCQEVTAGLAKKVADSGANAVYLDVFPVMRDCWDETHGHPLGVGGRWWAESLRQTLERIKREQGWDFGVTMEYFGEPYLDLCDVQMSWWFVEAIDCPLLPAIYSGYALWSGSHTHKHASDGLVAFRIKVGRRFLWGAQLGRSILSDYLFDERKGQFYRQLVGLKRKAAKFLVYGEMLRPPRWLSEVPQVTVEGWAMHPQWLPPFRYDAVEASLWKAPDGELALFLVNYDDRPHTVQFEVGDWWGEGQRPVEVLTWEGQKPGKGTVRRGEKLTVQVPAASALAWVFDRYTANGHKLSLGQERQWCNGEMVKW